MPVRSGIVALSGRVDLPVLVTEAGEWLNLDDGDDQGGALLAA